MYCKNCGNKLPPESKFCPFCGCVIREKKMTPGIIVLIVAVVCLFTFTVGYIGLQFMEKQENDSGKEYESQEQSSDITEDGSEPAQDEEELLEEEDGSDTPSSNTVLETQKWEDPDMLIKAFLQNLSSMDIVGALSLCDISEVLRYYDWKTSAENLAVFSSPFYKPTNGKVMSQITSEELRFDNTYALFTAWCTLFSNQSAVAKMYSEEGALQYDENAADEFLALVSDENLSKIRYIAIDGLDFEERPQGYDEENIQRILNNTISARFSGAVTNFKEYLIVMSIDEQYSVFGVTVYQYDNKWKIHDFTATNLGLPTKGIYLSELEGMSIEEAMQVAYEEYGVDSDRIIFP